MATDELRREMEMERCSEHSRALQVSSMIGKFQGDICVEAGPHHLSVPKSLMGQFKKFLSLIDEFHKEEMGKIVWRKAHGGLVN